VARPSYPHSSPGAELLAQDRGRVLERAAVLGVVGEVLVFLRVGLMVSTCRLVDGLTVKKLAHYKCRSCGSNFDDDAMHTRLDFKAPVL